MPHTVPLLNWFATTGFNDRYTGAARRAEFSWALLEEMEPVQRRALSFHATRGAIAMSRALPPPDKWLELVFPGSCYAVAAYAMGQVELRLRGRAYLASSLPISQAR
jgi:hypothetical protein